VNELPKERELHVHIANTMTDDLHMQRTAAMHNTLCQISGFHCKVVEVFALPGLYASLVGSSLLMFQDSLSIPFSRVKQSMKNARNI
jgi:hypothetical protein